MGYCKDVANRQHASIKHENRVRDRKNIVVVPHQVKSWAREASFHNKI